MKSCWSLSSRVFSAANETGLWFLAFTDLACDRDLRVLSLLGIPGLSPTWSWCLSLFCVVGFSLLFLMIRMMHYAF